MSYHNVPWPLRVQQGSDFEHVQSVSLQEFPSGREQRVARWADEKRVYNGAFGALDRADIMSVRKFLRARGWTLHSFPFTDPSDYASTANGRVYSLDELDIPAVTNTDQFLGTGDGVEIDFQLTKRYADPEVTVVRNIEKPVATTVLVAVDGVAQVEGVDFTVDYSLGIVSFAVAPTLAANITCGFQFYVPVRLNIAQGQGQRFSQVGFEVGSTNIPLIEVFGEAAIDDEAYRGGGSTIVPIANQMLSTQTHGAAVKLQPAADVTIRLPNASARTTGGPHFSLFNDSAFDVTVNSAGSLVAVIPANTAVEAWVFETSTVKEWVLF